MEMLDILEVLETEHGIFTNNEVTGQTAEEVYDEWLEQQEQIDICSPTKTNQQLEEENKQQWDTVNFLLKDGGFIPKESEVI